MILRNYKHILSNLLLLFFISSCSNLEKDKYVESADFALDIEAHKIMSQKCVACHSAKRKLSSIHFDTPKEIIENKTRILSALKSKLMPPSNIKIANHPIDFPPLLSEKERALLIAKLEKPSAKTNTKVLISSVEKKYQYEFEKNDFENHVFSKNVKATINPRGFHYGCLIYKIPEKYEGMYIKKIKNISKDPSYIHHDASKIVYMGIKEEDVMMSGFSCHAKIQEDEKGGLIFLGADAKSGYPVLKNSYIVIQLHLDRSFDKSLEVLNYDKELTWQIIFAKDVKDKIFGYQMNDDYRDISIPFGKKLEVVRVEEMDKTSEIFFSGLQDFKFRNLVSFLPHMHLFGKRYRLELITNGKSELLIESDFDWSHHFPVVFDPPINIEGKKLKLTCFYDNSYDNPNAILFNPEKKEITGGGGSLNEMCTLFINMDTKQI